MHCCPTFSYVKPNQESDNADKQIHRGAHELIDVPASGRHFTATRRVSIDDATPNGRMQHDAIARFLQDVGNDDTDDAEMGEAGMAWVARRATIEVRSPAVSRELLTLTTWCSGTGRRWAERRTRLSGEHGARIEAATVWINLDPVTGRPSPWGEKFSTTYLEATQGRLIDSKLRHNKTVGGSASMPWTFRQTDLDGFGHVNNTAYLAIAEEFLDLDGPQRVEIEWRQPSGADEQLLVHSATTGDLHQLWVVSADGDLRVTITAAPL